MATDTVVSVPTMVPQTMSSADLDNGTGVGDGEKLQAEEDDRSSSLSELGDRAGIEHSSRAGSEANDTEAETERLEDSPQKQRRHRDMVLSSTNSAHGEDRDQLVARVLSEKLASPGPKSKGERLEQTSDISSLEDSGEESGKDLSLTLSTPMKRKRSSFEQDSASDQDSMPEPSKKAIKLFDNNAAEASAKSGAEIAADVPAANSDLQVIAHSAMSPSNEEQPRKPQALPKQKHKKGKRKGKRTLNDEPANAEHAGSGAESTVEHGGNAEAMYSNEEDAPMENMAEGVEAGNLLKMEELVEKKSAMDSLSAIERCFAKLRDKIYEERIAQCNHELAMLEQPVPIHPEMLAMKEVIDQRRDQKVEYENKLMKFKLMTLQRESIANKAQAHSQYMQTVREVRDSYLESLNRKYYQVQRERRSCEGDVPDYMYTFTTKRSQQITHQTAYNTEVSILAGVAKYVGFPAAPEISSARAKEIDDDLRSMGIAFGAAQNAQSHHAALRANLSATASFPRQRPGAEEHFLEQNPWANPQHPAHHQQRMHRQMSATPSFTPAGQRRLVDLTEPRGSASTIAEPQSGPSSSMAPTPATGEASKLVQSGRNPEMSEIIVDSTPSRVVNGSLLDSTPANLAMQESSRAKATKKDLPSLPKNMSTDSQTPSALPKPLPFMHTGGSAPGIRTSTPVRYPVVKAEDATVGSRHSPIPHQFHGAAPVSTASNGQMNRFAA
ncbi:hypothetical protein HO173_005330 [Letharia columbiana]|uniref:Transcriptional regulatory protein DEP1 n=1 Tax=Letharia columbiana TaxID=112416 RepID=A0A8H6FXB1_9LECA|nr:uncharacterized protein HO173_005330 [Letharia columbiana]KAF6236549.1 hypothetical protein HO173_005330 [Letharia columbiana]